jgi:hypothetical protein
MLALRGSGVAHGEISLDTSVAPQAPAEVVAAALPLVVHPEPDHVLVVGLGGSVAVSSCLEFPVRTVTCIEQDADLLRIMRTSLSGTIASPFDDPRVEVRRMAPVLASSAAPERTYDVVLLNERQLAGPRSVGLVNVESYRRWAGQMSEDGILCQRLQYVDVGAEPVRDLARTMTAAFSQVILWESAPGELLLLATNSERPLVGENLLTRLETPHVRRLLGRIGWDVSVPLSVISVKPEHMQAMVESECCAVTAANGRFSFRLPAEIARWGAKGVELQRLLRAHALPVANWLPESPELEAMRKRMADMAEQRNIVAQHPDHYWAYRKTLRQRLQERPRSTIVQVKHEGLRKETHPEDVRRKEYLVALGAAATQEEPSAESIAEVAQFAEPYDPLLTPFLHGEVARLYTRCATEEPEQQLKHLLYAVYYSPGVDRSVREVVSAIKLLTDESCRADDAERWDHVNALLETLRVRWGLRSQQKVPSRFDAADARATISTAKQAIEFLERTAPDAGIDPEWSDLRCRVLDRTLVRSLRSFHAEQAAKLERIEEQRAAANQTNVNR